MTHWEAEYERELLRRAGATHERPARRLNSTEREQWVGNDEGLYSWWQRSKLSKREFIRRNKAEIDAAIETVLSGKRSAHYMAYEFNPERLSGVSGKRRSSRRRGSRKRASKKC